MRCAAPGELYQVLGALNHFDGDAWSWITGFEHLFVGE
jgi:hypothetical protein